MSFAGLSKAPLLKPGKGIMATARKSISKKTRFDIFKRDSFCCQYCGAKPPEVVLELDHITPLALGGVDDKGNLITACQPCNRGKSASPLQDIPPSLQDRADAIKERRLQISAFERLIKQEAKRTESFINEVELEFQKGHPNQQFSQRFRGSVRRFLDSLTPLEVVEAMSMAVSRVLDAEATTKYFCGICWKRIKESN